MTFIDIIKILGACAAIIGTCFTILNSKRVILWRIEKKEAQIRHIDHFLFQRDGPKRKAGIPMSNMEIRRNKLERQINDLKRFI